ncbi:MAG: [NiFe]-hydrogenase assembly chaperone HybE [Woeseiaceae bacterium]|nr:[NiFe]-hydrogenase assembly chaperone HybE [Woeseiaceae bacterium]
MTAGVTALVDHFRAIAAGKMQGLPIVNPALDVEAVGFARDAEGHETGVLIAPWFMNLVILPATDAWDALPAGATVDWSLPSGRYEMTVCRDDRLGTYLTAVLFRSVTDFPDRATARAVAREIVAVLGRPPAQPDGAGRRLSRRALFSGLGAS